MLGPAAGEMSLRKDILMVAGAQTELRVVGRQQLKARWEEYLGRKSNVSKVLVVTTWSHLSSSLGKADGGHGRMSTPWISSDGSMGMFRLHSVASSRCHERGRAAKREGAMEVGGE